MAQKPQFWRDGQWWLAMAAGPVVWLALVAVRGMAEGWWSSLSAVSVFALLGVVVLKPLVEELLFRGIVQTWLLRFPFGRKVWVPGLSGANLLTAVAFALAHLIGQPVMWAAAVFVPGLVFGYFRERSGDVWAGFVLHAWYNFGFFLLWPPG